MRHQENVKSIRMRDLETITAKQHRGWHPSKTAFGFSQMFFSKPIYNVPKGIVFPLIGRNLGFLLGRISLPEKAKMRFLSARELTFEWNLIFLLLTGNV